MNKSKLISLLLAISMVLSMVVLPVAAETEPAEQTGVCPACAEHDGAWDEIAAADWSAGGALTTGHYKLTEDVAIAAALTVGADQVVCIDLAGFDITAPNTAGVRAFEIAAGGTLTVLDTTAETVEGVYTSGVISGGYMFGTSSAPYAYGGNIYNEGTFNLYGGTISGGKLSANTVSAYTNGGNIYGAAGSVINIYDGLITEGLIDPNAYSNKSNGGANLYVAGALTIEGGTISDGYIDGYTNTGKTYNKNYQYGGNIFVAATGSLTMNGGTISGGEINNVFSTAATAATTVYAYGGNIYCAGAMTMSGGTISGGTVFGSYVSAAATAPTVTIYSNGGNIYLTSEATLTMTGGTITEGFANYAVGTVTSKDPCNGGNIYNAGTVNMSGGTISDGRTVLGLNGVGRGGNVYNALTFNMSGDAVVSGGLSYYRGGNFFLGGTVTLSDNAVVTGGTLDYDYNVTNGTDTESYTAAYGGNFYGGGTLKMYDNAVVTGGVAYHGGNIHTATSNGKIYMYGGAVYGGNAKSAADNIRIYNHASVVFTMYGGYVENAQDHGTSNTINIYNGVLGTDPSTMTTASGTVIASCAHTAELRDGYYNVYHASGTCATCAHTYSAYGVSDTYESDDTNHLTLGGAHTFTDGVCACGYALTEHTAACSHGCENVTWVPFDGVTLEDGGHYYLADNMVMADVIILNAINACIDLNGYTLTAPPAYRAFQAISGAELALMDSSANNTGILRSFTLPANLNGANLRANAGSALYLYDLTVANGTASGTGDGNRGGNIYVVGEGAKVVVDNAKIVNGTIVYSDVSRRGGNLCAYQGATIVIKGEDAKVTGGYVNSTADANAFGGNIHSGQGAYLYIYDGEISGGYAKGGANICWMNGEEANGEKGYFYMYGGTVGAVHEDCTKFGVQIYGSDKYQNEFYMFGGRMDGLDDMGEYNTIKIYAGVLSQDPRTLSESETSLLADCACVTYDGETGLYTVGHINGTAVCGICSANDGGLTAGYSEAYTYTLTAAHQYEEEATVCAHCLTVAAKLGETEYTELSKALAAATAEDTVTLMKDVEANGNVDIYCALDLNGNKLSASGVVDAFNADASITDSVGTGTATGSSVKMYGTNGQLAIDSANNGVYSYETVEVKQKKTVVDEDNTSVKFIINKDAESTLLDDAILAGSDVKVRITVTSDAITDGSHSFVFGQDLVGQYAADWNNKMFTCAISGLEALGEYTITAEVVSGGVVVEAITVE